MKKTILIAGAGGMLGQDLVKIFKNSNYQVIAANRKDFDATRFEEVEEFISKHRFDIAINCIAYTNVDKAESEKELAFLVNETGAKNIAIATAKKNIPIIYISTDYVFDGKKNEPYLPSDTPNPINVYGASKLAGEVATQKNNPQHYIIRTSWLYASHGKNFVNTMLELAKTHKEIKVVNDQIGCPTSTTELGEMIKDLVESENLFSERFLAEKLANQKADGDKLNQIDQTSINELDKIDNDQHNISKKRYGIYHFCGEKSMSWFEFAQEIFKKNNLDVKVIAVPTTEFPRPAKRPIFSEMSSVNSKNVFDSELQDSKKITSEITANILNFNIMGDNRGNLISLESGKNIPFDVKRVYYIFGSDTNIKRGCHAHKNLKQILICTSGSCRVRLDNGFKKEEIILDSPSKGLLIDSLVWREMYNFSKDCVLMVLANELYNEKDYIRSYQDFLEYKKF
jgi:dTDP-4-dehydrorhamnose reductase